LYIVTPVTSIISSRKMSCNYITGVCDARASLLPSSMEECKSKMKKADFYPEV
jgi:hypothetical protein